MRRGKFYQLLRALKHSIGFFIYDYKMLASGVSHLEGKNLEKYHQRFLGLHSLMDGSDAYSTSIVFLSPGVPDKKVNDTIRCCSLQTTPQLEILVGVEEKFLKDYQKITSERAALRFVPCDFRKPVGENLNFLAGLSQGKFLFFIESPAWLQLDCLYRLEQCMRAVKNSADVALIPTVQNLNQDIVAPYYFTNVADGIFLSRENFERSGKFNSSLKSAYFYDFILNASHNGIKFKNVPLSIYRSLRQPNNSQQEMQQSFANYLKITCREWSVESGEVQSSIRAIPAVNSLPTIHAIIPYKDNRELTVKAVRSLLRQKEVKVKVTAVDNGSRDQKIAWELSELGCEVINQKIPFNFSKLCNIGVRQSQLSTSDELILFLNNDVELDENALLEMARWAVQPEVGAVGCRLHFPNGKIQHAGIDISLLGPANKITWVHTDGGKTYANSHWGKITRVTAAVTAAACLMRREVFDKVGGFDEIFFPVGYSDTDLAKKIRNLGYVCLYTPHAFGTHFESASRGKGELEEVESSRWYNDLIDERMGL